MATLINPRIRRFKLWNAVLAKKQASQKPVNIFCSSNGQQVWADSLYRRESPEEEIYKVAGRFDHPGRLAPRLVCLSAGVLLSTLSMSHAVAAETVFDELRFGASGSINTGNSRESGLFPSATIFFDPLSSGTATTWQSILEPRIYLGASAGTGSGVDQVFGGFSWDRRYHQPPVRRAWTWGNRS